MNYWVITDTHFGHDNIMQYCNRPRAFEELILKNLKLVVRDGDIVIHLGDTAFRKHDYWVARFCQEVPGTKWLCLGNHDKESPGWFRSRGFYFVCQVFSLSLYGKTILFSHDFVEKEVLTKLNIDMNIHGHQHNNGPQGKWGECYYHMAVEHTDYNPIRLVDITKQYDTKRV